jgi:predicted aconitase
LKQHRIYQAIQDDFNINHESVAMNHKSNQNYKSVAINHESKIKSKASAINENATTMRLIFELIGSPHFKLTDCKQAANPAFENSNQKSVQMQVPYITSLCNAQKVEMDNNAHELHEGGGGGA